MAYVLQLPCGIQQSDGTWTKEVEIDEMDSECENILLDQQEVAGTLVKSGTQRITEVLSRCTLRIGNESAPILGDGFPDPKHFLKHWSGAYMNDRGFGVVRLRQFSKGNLFVFSQVCPYAGCNKEVKGITVDLNGLEVTSIPLEMVQKGAFETTLPKCGKVVTWRMLTADDELELERIGEKRKDELVTALIYLRMKSFDGKPLNGKSTIDIIKRIKTSDLDYLRAQFNSVTAGIDTSIEAQCSIPYEDKKEDGTIVKMDAGCKRWWHMTMPVSKPSFFFPSASNNTSKETSSSSPSAGGSIPSKSSDGPSASASAP